MGSDKMRQASIYLYVFIGLATGAYKEHIGIFSLAAPCRFPYEQAKLNKADILELSRMATVVIDWFRLVSTPFLFLKKMV